MATVDEMLDDILRHEGGLSNHANDRGSWTKFGVTIGALSRWLGRAATVDEIKGLTVETAREIFETTYYRAPRIDSLPERIQPVLFDISVNSGPRRAIKMLQRVCQEAGYSPNGIDGVVGPGTRKAAVAADEAMGDWLVAAICQERQDFYDAIVENDPSQQVFAKGWRNRAMAFWPSSVESMVA